MPSATDPERTVAVVGAGVFGVTAALALRRRGYRVTLIDPGPLPHPLAASTDISKVVRLDYGPDADYTALMERALDGWREWNAVWPEPLFHETGIAFLCRAPMSPGGFEHDSFDLLCARGHRPERLDARAITTRFPAWQPGRYVDGYFNPDGGWAESGRVVARLVEESRRQGIVLRAGAAVAGLAAEGSRVTGVRLTGADAVRADRVVVAAGAWTPHLLPHLAEQVVSTGQPVFHLAPPDRTLFEPDRFPVFGADLSRTGYYGFPVNRDGVVKIAHHGSGRAMHPESPERAVTAAETRRLREFLHDTFPVLAPAPIVFTRVCLYADTTNGHFLIARDPAREGLVVATGDSGHGFKFAPVLGDIVADAVEGVTSPLLDKFRWRPGLGVTRTEEAARFQG